MAAAPGTPLLVPPPKTEKKDPGDLATATAGWSSLPDDLVRRIADSLLATYDVDCYMCCRSVCHGWRATTDDPRSNSSDRRFMPLVWIVIDEAAQGKLLLLNTRTGRFLQWITNVLRQTELLGGGPYNSLQGKEMDAAPPVLEEPPARDWSMLPLDALVSVFVSVGVVDVLLSAVLVCHSWY